MSVLEFKKPDQWGAIEAIEYAKERMESKTPVLVLYLDKDQNLNYTSANFNNLQLNYALDQIKLSVLMGE